MTKMNLSAPLPFVGQKRMFAKEFIKVLDQFPDDTVFVDLFGGSGLLSQHRTLLLLQIQLTIPVFW